MRLFKLGVIFAIWGFIIFTGTSAFAVFVVTPMEFHLSTSAGEATTGFFVVKNRGSETIALKVYMGDFWIHPDGKESFLEPGKVERSCGKWIELAPEEFELMANETKTVRFNLTIPSGKTGTFWAMIFIEQTNKPTIKTAQKGQQQFNIISFQRVGVRIFEDTPDSVKGEGRITQVSVEKAQKEEFLKVGLRFENKGDMLLKCKGSVDIKNQKGETVDKTNVDEFNCYPKAERVVTAFFKKELLTGQYTALAVIDYGAEYLVAGEALFKVNPVTSAIEMVTGHVKQAGSSSKEAAVSGQLIQPGSGRPAKEKIGIHEAGQGIIKIKNQQIPKNNFMQLVRSVFDRVNQAFRNLFRK